MNLPKRDGKSGFKSLCLSILMLCLLAVGQSYAAELEYSFTFNTVDLLEDGQPLTDLAGYRLYFAVDEDVTTDSPFVAITLDQVLSETVVNFDIPLTPRIEPYTLQVAITAIRTNDVMGVLSETVVKRFLVKDIVQPARVTGFFGTLRCLSPGCEVVEI